MTINPPSFLLAATTAVLASTFSSYLPAQALTWTISNGSVDTNPSTVIVGSFTIDNESGTPPSVSLSNIVIDSLTFTAADVVNISLATPSGSGIEAIDWVNGLDSLSLVFNSPLTTAGGTILLNNIVSDFNGHAVSGSVVAGSQPPISVPEPSTIIGLVTTVGCCLFWKRRLKDENKAK